MTFEGLWDLVWRETKLPKEAKKHFPQSLSEKTKQKILSCGKTPTEIAKAIEAVVDEIDYGSVTTVDELVRKLLLGE